MARVSIVLLYIFVTHSLTGCSLVNYRTLYDGAKDPTFDFETVETIGFMPTYWTTYGKRNGQDELREKEIFGYFKENLERMGYSVSYIDPKNLEELDGDKIVTTGLSVFPDLTLIIGFSQNHSTIKVPAKSSAFSTGGALFYSSSGAQQVNYYNLRVGASLWANPPEYMKEVCRGIVLQGSPTPNLSEKARGLVEKLLDKKFPIRKHGSKPKTKRRAHS